MDFFDAVGCPADNTGHCENRSVKFLRESDHLVDETGIEIKVCTDWLVSLAVGGDAFATFFLDTFQELKLLYETFFLSKLPSHILEDLGTRIAHCINCMTKTVDKS